MVLNIVKARSYFLRRDYLALGCLTAANAGVMLLLVILGEFPKRYQCDKQSVGKEAARGFWGRTLFVWLNATLLFGFRNKLSVDDLPSLGSGFSSARLAAAFEPVWVKRMFLEPILPTYRLTLISRLGFLSTVDGGNFLVINLVVYLCRASSPTLHCVLVFTALSHQEYPRVCSRGYRI